MFPSIRSCLVVLATAVVSSALLRAETAVEILHVPEGMDVAIVRQEGEVTVKLVPKPGTTRAAATAPAAAASPAPAAVAPPRSRARFSVVDEQTPPGEPLARPWPEIELDRPIAAVPAFVALDLSPESVAQPTTPRDFAAALLNGIDRKGTLQTGVAVETTPFRVLGWRPDSNRYNQDGLSGYWTRFFYNFSLSLATAKATADDDDKSVNLAIGLQAILWQDKKNDPLRNERLRTAFHRAFAGTTTDIPADGELTAPERVTDAQALWATAVQTFREQEWIGTLWTASIAPTWQSASGNVSDLHAQGFTAWSTFGYAFEDFPTEQTRLQFVAQLRYRDHERVVDETYPLRIAHQDSLLAAARFRIGSPNFNAFAEGAYLRVWNGLEGDGGAWRAAAGFERRIATNIWFVVSAGEQFGEATLDNEFFALGTFRFGSSERAALAPSR